MTENKASSILLAVSVPPFWHCGRTIKHNNLHFLLALLPAVAFAIFHWGLPALRVMALAVSVGVLTEYLSEKFMGRELQIDDYSSVISSLLLAFLLPADTVWWVVFLGVVLSILLGKMFFGGYGSNPVNTTLVGWAMLTISFPLFVDPNTVQLNTNYVDPLFLLKYYGVDTVSQIPLLDLALGYQIGGLGASQVLALIIGGFYIAARGIIRWEISFSFIVSVCIFAAIFNLYNPELYAGPLIHIFTGSTILAAFFLATEHANSPNYIVAMCLYGLIGGFMVIVIRNFGVYTDGVPFAILFINLLTPQLDKIHRKPFGVR